MTIGMDTAKETAIGAVETAKDAAVIAAGAVKGTAVHAAGAVKGSALDTAKNVLEFVSFLRGLGVNDVLGVVGLSRKRSPLESIAFFGGGILVGAGIGFLVAPVSGRDARRQILDFVGSLSGQAKERVGEVKEKASEIVDQVEQKASDVASQVKEKVGDVTSEVKEKLEGATGEAEGATAQGEEGGKGTRRRHNQQQLS